MRKRLRRVVVGVDGSAEAFAAARYAAWEADRRDVGVRLVFAHQPTPMWGPSTVVLDDYAWERDFVRGLSKTASAELSAAHPNLPIDAVVVNGRPAAPLWPSRRRRAC